ncbi:MAG: flagellar biosynthesis protein FlgM [Opitutales bacterium]|nr:flagellar biosynthesis protein FlgM [Opitutales bacterium]
MPFSTSSNKDSDQPSPVELLSRNVWTGGQLLAFSGLDGQTDYKHGLTARTAFESPGLDIVLPGHFRVRFSGDSAKEVVVTGDTFSLGTGADAIAGAFIDAHHLLLRGPCLLPETDSRITWKQHGERTLIGSTSHFDPQLIDKDLDAVIAERHRWLEGISLPPKQSLASQRTLLKSLALMKTQVYSPEGIIQHRWTTPDRWPHRAMWLWDSVFHVIGLRHLDADLARDALSAVFDSQTGDGFVAHRMDPFKQSRITQPPILSLGAKLVHDQHPSPEWIETLYPKLSAYLEWDMAHRDQDGGGLLEWDIEGNPHCRSGESGMDNSPRFDDATQMDAVDFNAFLALECEIMAGFATELKRGDEAVKWSSRHAHLCQLIRERLWSESDGFFVDCDLDKGAPSSILANSGFLPLICGAATPEQAEKLVEHLQNPRTFGTPFPVPSVAAFQAESYGKDMWRGPVWINLNWLIAFGLDRYSFNEVATKLREQTMQEIELYCEAFGCLFEFYDALQEDAPPQLLRKGKCAPEEGPYKQVFHDFGWTATLYVDLCFGR